MKEECRKRKSDNTFRSIKGKMRYEEYLLDLRAKKRVNSGATYLRIIIKKRGCGREGLRKSVYICFTMPTTYVHVEAIANIVSIR